MNRFSIPNRGGNIMDKTKAFINLYQLLIFYSENRDQPVSEGFDFFEEVRNCCNVLGIDSKEIEKEFNLNFFDK